LAISAKLSAVFMAAVSSVEPATFMALQLKNIYIILKTFYKIFISGLKNLTIFTIVYLIKIPIFLF